MDPNIGSILKDKRLLAGLGVAAAVGLVVFLRRGGSSTSTAAAGPSTAPSSTGYYTGTGTADTTGTDMASYLGSWGSSLMDAVRQQTAQPTATTPVETAPSPYLMERLGNTGTREYTRIGWEPVEGATGYRVSGPGDSQSYDTGVAMADWFNPTRSGAYTVTPIFAGGVLGKTGTLTV